MNTIKKFVALSALAVSLMPGIVLAADLSGTYQCDGHDPFSKKPYSGSLVINKTGDTYNFKWDFSKGNLGIIIGTGLVAKNTPDVLAAVFADSEDVKNVGVISYKIMSDGSLDGSWTIPGEKLVGDEICKVVKAVTK